MPSVCKRPRISAALAVFLRQAVAERAVGEAQLEVADHLRVREAARLQILHRLGTLLQRFVIVIDHLPQHALIVGVDLERRLQFHRLRGSLADHAFHWSG